MSRETLTLIAGAFLSVGVARGEPVTVLMRPAKDATLYQSSFGGTANGSGQHLFAGVTIREGAARRGLLMFNVGSVVPAGSRVVAATLTLNLSRALSDQPSLVTVHPVLRGWNEGPTDPEGEEGAGETSRAGDCTWIHTASPAERWSTPGGDFGGSASGIVVNNLGVYTWPTGAGFVAMVQRWVDEPGSNFGMLLRGNEAASGNAKRFDSRENPDAALRPVLTVSYECGADFNGDGFLDFFDYSAYVECFEVSGACPPGRDADFNRDGFVDFFDYAGFVEVFETGC